LGDLLETTPERRKNLEAWYCFIAGRPTADTGDEMVLEAAVNGRADALVTFNQRDFGDAPSRFGVELLLPREAIARIIR
jgi:predicted nucleic acid-binding protein